MNDDLSVSGPEWSAETLAVALGRPSPGPGASVNEPLDLSTTFHAGGSDIYGRESNAQWRAFEEVVAALEGGRQAVCFPSGMAAIDAALQDLPQGATVVVPTIAYAGTRARLNAGAASGRWRLRSVDITDTGAVARAALGADALMLESPTNPLLDLCDLRAAAVSAREAGARLIVDNTFATPLGQRPLAHGADVVVHSATKQLAGHSDVLLGVLVTNDEELAERVRTERTLNGTIPSAFDAMLALRGVRTLAVRHERACASAGILAVRLAEHPRVLEVRYPGLPADPGHDLAREQMMTFGSMIGVLVDGDGAEAEAVADRVTLWTHATSLGGVESTLERRRRWPFEHPDVPPHHLRLSVGIEAVDDLWADLDQALTHRVRTSPPAP
jgi:cystathionine gamma-synthase